jgi:hypothetical protein
MPVTLSASAKAEIDTLLDAYPGGKHPGTVVGIINKQGEYIYLNAAGPRTGSEPEAMRTDHVGLYLFEANFRCSLYSHVLKWLLVLH